MGEKPNFTKLDICVTNGTAVLSKKVGVTLFTLTLRITCQTTSQALERGFTLLRNKEESQTFENNKEAEA